MTRPDSAGRFADGLAVDTQLAARDNPGGKAARFEKPSLPEPFVQPDCWARVRQSFLKPARAAANGLSGSICFSRLGLA